MRERRGVGVRSNPRRVTWALNVAAEVEDVAVPDDVVAAFEPKFARLKKFDPVARACARDRRRSRAQLLTWSTPASPKRR